MAPLLHRATIIIKRRTVYRPKVTLLQKVNLMCTAFVTTLRWGAFNIAGRIVKHDALASNIGTAADDVLQRRSSRHVNANVEFGRSAGHISCSATRQLSMDPGEIRSMGCRNWWQLFVSFCVASIVWHRKFLYAVTCFVPNWRFTEFCSVWHRK